MLKKLEELNKSEEGANTLDDHEIKLFAGVAKG